MDWITLIRERDEWVEHNFPHSPTPDGSILGIIEELGELSHAHLKQEQKIRGDGPGHESAAMDAIGDLTIYLLGIMSHLREVPRRVAPLTLASERWTLKHLAHEVGVVAINPSIYGCERIVGCLERYCEFRGWDYEEIVVHTWASVKARDWIKFPGDGVTA